MRRARFLSAVVVAAFLPATLAAGLGARTGGAAAAPAAEQCTTTSYDGFAEPLPAALTRNGTATITTVDGDEVLRMTQAESGQRGSAFTTSKVDLLNDASFSAAFDFRFSGQTAEVDGHPSGADGLVFTIQNVDDEVGGSGGGIGYGGIDRSVGVEFDNWWNFQGYVDPAIDQEGIPPPAGIPPDSWIGPEHVGIDLNGSVHSVAVAELPDSIVLDEPVVHHAWVDYDGSTDLLEVRISDGTERPATPLLSHEVDLPAILGGAGAPVESAFLGFTSATGALVANHDVLSWTFSNCFRPVGTDSAPYVDAGDGYEGVSSSPVAIAGAASDDLTSPLPVQWTATGPGTCTFSAPTQVAGTVNCTAAGTYTLTLSADDGTNAPVTDTATLQLEPFNRPRLAFTDDKDALYRLDVERVTLDGLSYHLSGPPASAAFGDIGFQTRPIHEGEAGGAGGGRPAFISTHSHSAGEVYLGFDRITCNTAVESHPVVDETETAIAFASNADGDWDIYVAQQPPSSGPARPAPGWAKGAAPEKRAAAAEECNTALWPITQVTDGAADDLWPTWLADGSLAFSRAEPGALSDIFLMRPDGEGGWDAPTALTSTPDTEEAQPSAMRYSVDPPPPDGGCEPACFPVPVVQDWIAYVADQNRIEMVSPQAPDGPAPSFFIRGVGEPAWSSTVNPTHLAYSVRYPDPYGGIGIAELDLPSLDAEGNLSEPLIDAEHTINGLESGVAATHPHWLTGFDGTSDTTAELVVTMRSTRHVYVESRTLQADISDVRVADGTQRRVIRRDEVVDPGDLPGPEDDRVTFAADEAGPSYSPDGTQIAYSADVPTPNFPDARVLMVAMSDGANPEPLLPPALRQPGDIDLDPVWSPDGARVAFVRVRDDGEGQATPQVWVFDVAAGTTSALAHDPDTVDTSPSWSPGGERLVVARTRAFASCCTSPVARRWGYAAAFDDAELVLLDPAQPDAEGVPLAHDCGDGCFEVGGRSPAWSPDGTRIAYVTDGQIDLVTLPPDWATTTDEVIVGPGFAVTGETWDHEGYTPSRSVISLADDPAWSPDGAEIAFAGQPAGQPDQRGIYGIAPDGTGLRVITDRRGPETEPAWEPAPADVGVTVTVLGSPALVGQALGATMTVTNNGPGPARDVALTTAFSPGAVLSAPAAPVGCATDGTGCTFTELAPGESRVYEVAFQHPAAVAAGQVTATVTSLTLDPVGDNNEATAPYVVNAGTGADVLVGIVLDEPTGYVGGLRLATVSMMNRGPAPATGVTWQVTWPELVTPSVPLGVTPGTEAPDCILDGTPCVIGDLAAGEVRAYDVALATETAGSGTLRSRVTSTTTDPAPTNNTATLPLTVLQPTIRVVPAVARPGQVVVAYGEDMPPGEEVELTWDKGTNLAPGAATVAEDGTLRTSLLILRRDRIGARILTATSTTEQFSPVTGDLLVVLRTLSPPDLVGRG